MKWPKKSSDLTNCIIFIFILWAVIPIDTAGGVYQQNQAKLNFINFFSKQYLQNVKETPDLEFLCFVTSK